MLVDDARLVLGAWQDQLLRDDDVRSWAYEVLKDVPAAELPEWLLDLATLGPSACMNRPSSDFLHVPRLDFASGFSLLVQASNFADIADLDAFITWTSRACIGEDLARPDVRFGYQLDHYMNDSTYLDECERLDLARGLVREQIPALRNRVVPVPQQVVELVRRSKLREREADR